MAPPSDRKMVRRSLADRRDAAARAGDLDWAGPRRYEADADVTGGLV